MTMIKKALLATAVVATSQAAFAERPTSMPAPAGVSGQFAVAKSMGNSSVFIETDQMMGYAEMGASHKFKVSDRVSVTPHVAYIRNASGDKSKRSWDDAYRAQVRVGYAVTDNFTVLVGARHQNFDKDLGHFNRGELLGRYSLDNGHSFGVNLYNIDDRRKDGDMITGMKGEYQKYEVQWNFPALANVKPFVRYGVVDNYGTRKAGRHDERSIDNAGEFTAGFTVAF